MAGRNLFAAVEEEQPRVGRNLFATEVPQPTGESFTPDVVGGDTRNISSGSPFNEEGVTLPGIIEPAATLASAAIAEPVAGLAGIAQSLNPLAKEGAGEQAIQSTREALTYQPKTEVGKEITSGLGEVLAPVGEFLGKAEKGLGDTVFDSTGSPALAAAATTIPTALMEVAGLAMGRGALNATRKMKKSRAEGNIMREIDDATPTIDKLKETSRQVYKEIDEMGVSVDPQAYRGLVNRISHDVRKAGLDKDITPKAEKALVRLEEMVDKDVSLSELDTLRKVAQNAASAIEPAEAMLGVRMIEKIDDFLDKSDATSLKIPAHIDNTNVGQRYKIARDMWGRARKSELLEEVFEKARNQASGFENGIRTQFRAILNNKKKSRYFNQEELAAVKKVVRGDKKQNIARLIGTLGFMEGGAKNVVGSAIGIAGGATVGGPVGAVIVPMVGQVSRNLAQRMTVKGAEFADQVIRAGSNARQITAAYIKNTPRAQRSAQELSELLTRNDIDLINLPKDEIVTAAANIAKKRRAELSGALGAGGTESQLDR